MAEQTVSIKDSADEWSATPPDFRNNIDIEQSEKDILKKEKKNEDNKSISDLTMDFLQEHEKKTRIRKLAIENYTKVGDHVVSSSNFVVIDKKFFVVSQ